jgi:chorismate dehydratase
MNNKCIRVGIVNYRNTLPMLFGLHKLEAKGIIQLIKNYPSAIADDLQNGKIDVGLIPVAMIPNIKNGTTIGSHCIASEDTVASVLLFSNVPLQKIETVILDYQSRTSVQLVQILFAKLWKKKVVFVDAHQEYLHQITGSTAGVVIGDRAFENIDKYAYQYDLANGWKQLTGLPFVFAQWVSTIPLTNEFIAQFNAANQEGMAHIHQIVAEQQYTFYDLEKYYTQNISYMMDEAKEKSVQLFLSEIG